MIYGFPGEVTRQAVIYGFAILCEVSTAGWAPLTPAGEGQGRGVLPHDEVSKISANCAKHLRPQYAACRNSLCGGTSRPIVLEAWPVARQNSSG